MIKAITCLKGSPQHSAAMKHLQQRAKDEGFDLCYYTFNELKNVAEFIVDNPHIQNEGEGYKRELFGAYSPFEYSLLWRIIRALRIADNSELDSIANEIKISNQRVRRVLSNFLIKTKIKGVFYNA
ncbi:hypothetical protein QFX18_15230 [Saccharophagus degradans]|uniref:hypothetical protein n=1 Tax=Saccharophagus degradans TaxID=86304 RepID=UPI002477DC92|nr:hypothetical protein [Saccharophagus degradans]WGO97388.1 hypothetical protein QFX18_15230 [Saccharophagus degradans]